MSLFIASFTAQTPVSDSLQSDVDIGVIMLWLEHKSHAMTRRRQHPDITSA